MTHEELFTELKDLAAAMNVRLRFEHGDFDGGFCVLRDERMIMINRRATVAQKNSILSRALSQLGIDERYVKPAVREGIDDELAKLRAAGEEVTAPATDLLPAENRTDA